MTDGSDAVADVAATYFDAWQRGDFARLRAILADDVTFDGPLGHAGNAEECIAGLKRMSVTSIRAVFDPRPLSPPSGQ